jgi:Flp pilus assembly pilin Flp
LRPDSTSPPGKSPPLGDVTLEPGLTFVQILAAQREARRVVDGESCGQGAGSWCEVSPHTESGLGAALTDVDLPDSAASGDAGGIDAKRWIKPRIVGQGIVEYSLVVVLIAIVVIVLLGTLGHQAQDVFSNLSRGLAT